MSRSNFFQKKECGFLPIAFDPALTQATSPQQIKIVERLGVSIAVGTSKDGCFSFKEYIVGVVGEAGKPRKLEDIRCLLPQKGLTGLSDTDVRRYHPKEFKIEPGYAYNYVVLDRYFVDSLPKYYIGKDLKKVPFPQSEAMHSNTAASSLEFRLVPHNNHYFGAQEGHVVVAGRVTFNEKNQVIAIDNESGGYHVKLPEEVKRNKEAVNNSPEIRSQRAALETYGITNFEPYIAPEIKMEPQEEVEKFQSMTQGLTFSKST